MPQQHVQELVQQHGADVLLGLGVLRDELRIHQQQGRIVAQGDGQRRHLRGEDEPGDRQDALAGQRVFLDEVGEHRFEVAAVERELTHHHRG